MVLELFYKFSDGHHQANRMARVDSKVAANLRQIGVNFQILLAPSFRVWFDSTNDSYILRTGRKQKETAEDRPPTTEMAISFPSPLEKRKAPKRRDFAQAKVYKLAKLLISK